MSSMGCCGIRMSLSELTSVGTCECCKKDQIKIGYSVDWYDISKESERENWVSFDPCVDTMGWRPFSQSCLEASYCTSGCGLIIWHNYTNYCRHVFYRATPVLILWGGGHFDGHVWRRLIVPLVVA